MRIARPRIIFLVALVSALALMIGQSAFAHTWHEDAPTPQEPDTPVLATCTVEGSVTLDNHGGGKGVNATDPRHLHYTFTSTTLSCTDPDGNNNDYWGGGDPNDPIGGLAPGNYTVSADGGTDGLGNGTTHGETCAGGWSHSHLYSGGDSQTVPGNVNKGDIGVPTGPVTSPSGNPNWVKFLREAESVTAWGELTFSGRLLVKFYAELVFTPTEGSCAHPDAAVTDKGVTGANLKGDAVLYR